MKTTTVRSPRSGSIPDDWGGVFEYGRGVKYRGGSTNGTNSDMSLSGTTPRTGAAAHSPRLK